MAYASWKLLQASESLEHTSLEATVRAGIPTNRKVLATGTGSSGEERDFASVLASWFTAVCCSGQMDSPAAPG